MLTEQKNDLSLYSSSNNKKNTRKHIVITTSASGLDYYEFSHDVHIIPCTIELDGKALIDVEEICPASLSRMLEKNPDCKIKFHPPSVEQIHSHLVALLQQGYDEIFVISSTYKNSHLHFEAAIQGIPEQPNCQFHLYTANTLSLSVGLLALQADKLFGEGKTLRYVTNRLKAMEISSMLFYSVLDKQSVLSVDGKHKMKLPYSRNKAHDLMKMAHSTPSERIATFSQGEELLENMVLAIRDYIGNQPYNGYVIYPFQQEISSWFSETLTKYLGSHHITTLPVTPVIASMFGINFFAVRVYRLNKHLEFNSGLIAPTSTPTEARSKVTA